jgi:hypothetical protein
VDCGKEEKAALCTGLHVFVQSARLLLLHTTAMLCLMTAVSVRTAMFNTKCLHFAPTHAFRKQLFTNKNSPTCFLMDTDPVLCEVRTEPISVMWISEFSLQRGKNIRRFYSQRHDTCFYIIRQEKGSFTVSKPPLGSTQPSAQLVSGFSSGV